MSKKICLTLLSLTFALCNLSLAYDNFGASVAATGMGGAYVATAGDPASIFYNPAGLATIRQYSLYGMYNRQTTINYFLDEKPYALATAGAWPFYWGTVGLGFTQNGSWSKETQVVTHNTLALSFAHLISPQVSVGVNAKYLFNTNYGDKSGADADLGVMYFATPNLTFGLVGENLAGTDVEPDALGTYFLYNRRQVKLGIAYELINGEYRTRFGFDTIFKEKKGLATDGNNLNNFGIQQSLPFSLTSTVSFRAGYSLGKDYSQDFNSYALGVSYELHSGNNVYRFDYSYQDYPFQSSESMAGDNRIALTVFFGAPKNGNGFAHQKEKLNLAAVNKPEQKQAEPMKPAVQSKPTEQVKVTQPTKPTEQTKPAEPTKLTESTKLAEPTRQTERPKITEQSKPTESTKPAVSAKPADQTKVTELTKPIEQPKQPELAKATEQTKSVEPTKQNDKSAFKEKKVSDNPWEAPAEIKHEVQAPQPDDKSALKPLAQAKLGEFEFQKPAKPAAGGLFSGLKIDSKVESSQAKAKKDKSYMFMFQYNLEDKLGLVSDWNILIATTPSQAIMDSETDPNATQSIHGRGIPPTVVVWNAKDKNGFRVAPGKYYYALYLKSAAGEKFLSNWNPMVVE